MDLDLRAAADAHRGGGPLAGAVEREDRGLLEGRAEEAAAAWLMWWSAKSSLLCGILSLSRIRLRTQSFSAAR
jgi:hypothetical protein